MLGRTATRLIVLMFVVALAGIAQGQDNIQKYFNDTASKVKATADPSQKREILNKSFEGMSNAMNTVGSSALISKDDKAGIDRFKGILKEKQDELAGLNNYERVPDTQLDAFADYTVQDMEQAAETITISLVAMLLIIIILILVV